jgi:HSP20 family protein
VRADIARTSGFSSLTGQCSPPFDIFETDDAVEFVMDVPGVDATSIRIAASGLTLLVAGEKRPRRTVGDSSFHLVERGYGRFARAARLSTACDTARARATLSHGELRVSLPKIKDRRGRAKPIPITSDPPRA